MTNTPPKTNPPVPEGEVAAEQIIEKLKTAAKHFPEPEPGNPGALHGCDYAMDLIDAAIVDIRILAAQTPSGVSGEAEATELLSEIVSAVDAEIAPVILEVSTPRLNAAIKKTREAAAQLLQVTDTAKDEGTKDAAALCPDEQLGSGDGDRSGESDGPCRVKVERNWPKAVMHTIGTMTVEAVDEHPLHGVGGRDCPGGPWVILMDGDSIIDTGWSYVYVPDLANDLEKAGSTTNATDDAGWSIYYYAQGFNDAAANNTPTPESVSGGGDEKAISMTTAGMSDEELGWLPRSENEERRAPSGLEPGQIWTSVIDHIRAGYSLSLTPNDLEWLERLAATPTPNQPTEGKDGGSAAKESEVCDTEDCEGSAKHRIEVEHGVWGNYCDGCAHALASDPAAPTIGCAIHDKGMDCACFGDPAAQTPEDQLLVVDDQAVRVPADVEVIPHPSDRAEGEGPYKAGDRIVLALNLGSFEYELVGAIELAIANAAYLEGQASTHPKTERLERIEVAAKYAVGMLEDRFRRKKAQGKVPSMQDLTMRSQLAAALTSNEGER